MSEFENILGTLRSKGLRYFGQCTPYFAVQRTRSVEQGEARSVAGGCGRSQCILDRRARACYGAAPILNMDKSMTHFWCLVLTGLLLGVGCADTDPAPPEELTIQELNAALVYLRDSDKKLPGSVYELTNLPALQGKVFPALPPGQYYTIDTENLEVIIEVDRIPDMPDAFPHRTPE